jgi:hypothetical protein
VQPQRLNQVFQLAIILPGGSGSFQPNGARGPRFNGY